MSRIVLGLTLVLGPTGLAFAQTGKHLAVGAGFAVNVFDDENLSQDNPSPAFYYRIRLKPDSPQGWHWTASGAFDWFRPDVNRDIAGRSTRLGQLRARPVMVGIGGDYTAGRLNVGGSFVAGPSFNSFSVDDGARAAYRSRLGTGLRDVSVKPSLAVRPAVQVWYDLGRWVGLSGSIGYMGNRIKAETTIDRRRSSTTWKGDHPGVHVGVVVGVF